MPIFALLLLVFAQSQAPPGNSVAVVGHAWAPFISPMGEAFRARAAGEDTLVDWFRQADRNQDGFLTVEEMQADADRFFVTLDTDHNGEIEPEELVQYEWQIAPEIQVNSKLRRPRGSAPQPASAGMASDENRSRNRDTGDGRQGAARYALLNIPEPVAAADSNLDRAISRNEFRVAAIERFRLLDSRRQGQLSLQDLEALKPATFAPTGRAKRRKDSADTRYGVPLPSSE